MAFADTQTVSIAANSVLHTLARPFVAFGNMMIGLAEASSQAQELNHLADLSDAYLESKGTTRTIEVQKILRGYMYL
jgi:hypothetical protein